MKLDDDPPRFDPATMDLYITTRLMREGVPLGRSLAEIRPPDRADLLAMMDALDEKRGSDQAVTSWMQRYAQGAIQ